MTDDSETKQELELLRKGFNRQHQIQEIHRKREEAKSQIERAESLHVLVALAIIGGFFSLYSAEVVGIPSFNGCAISSKWPFVTCNPGIPTAETAFFINVTLSGLFLAFKSVTATFQPMVSEVSSSQSRVIEGINDHLLPAMHVVVLLGGVVFGIAAIVNIEAILAISPPMYLILEILFLIPAVKYAAAYGNTMEKFRTTTTDRTVSFTSGQRGGSTELKVQNPFAEKLSTDEVTFEVEAPEDVSIEIGQAVNIENNTWRPAHDIKPFEEVRFPITVKRGDEREKVETDQVVVTVRISQIQTLTEESKFTIHG